MFYSQKTMNNGECDEFILFLSREVHTSKDLLRDMMGLWHFEEAIFLYR